MRAMSKLLKSESDWPQSARETTLKLFDAAIEINEHLVAEVRQLRADNAQLEERLSALSTAAPARQ